MTEPGDIWQRYDAKVLQIQQLEARVAELEGEVATGHHERDHWTRVARQLNKKLQVARDLAQRLRAAQPEPPPSATPAGDPTAAVQAEFDRAREVLGLVLSALTRALDDDDEAVAELGRRLRHHAGGKLLYSITRGSLTLVPLDGRYLVDRQWLDRLDLVSLRGELDVAAQSGVYPLPPGSSIVHTQPPIRRPELQQRLAELGTSTVTPATPATPAPGARPPPIAISGELGELRSPPIAISGELEVDIDHDEYDAYADDGGDLPPPPPMPAAQLLMPPPPLLAALPVEDIPPPPRIPDAPRIPAPPRIPDPPRIPEPPRRLEDTMRGKVQTPAALTEAFIPNLRIGRLIKTPSGG